MAFRRLFPHTDHTGSSLPPSSSQNERRILPTVSTKIDGINGFSNSQVCPLSLAIFARELVGNSQPQTPKPRRAGLPAAAPSRLRATWLAGRQLLMRKRIHKKETFHRRRCSPSKFYTYTHTHAQRYAQWKLLGGSGEPLRGQVRTVYMSRQVGEMAIR